MTARSAVFCRGHWTRGRGVDTWRGSLFTACKEIWVQGCTAADISTVRAPTLQHSSITSARQGVFSPSWTYLSCRFLQIIPLRERTLAWLPCLREASEATPFSVSNFASPHPLAALCSLSSHWHQHKYYPNQRRKFFLNLDDKDIF